MMSCPTAKYCGETVAIVGGPMNVNGWNEIAEPLVEVVSVIGPDCTFGFSASAICVGEMTVKPTGTPPMSTEESAPRFVPSTSTVVALVPTAGPKLVMVGCCEAGIVLNGLPMVNVLKVPKVALWMRLPITAPPMLV